MYLANVLWAHGYYYTAVILATPVQAMYVLAHNYTLVYSAIIAANYGRTSCH